MKPLAVSLDDKYRKTEGRVFMTGIQALVRLLIDQRRADEAAGHNTGGFVSGYRGSPLGGFDQQLLRAETHLKGHGIRFEPGLNEDLGATAVAGTQFVDLFPGRKADGVFGMWYGKAPGVDRTGDAFKHANFDGTSPLGGVLAVAGDDHSAKSSSLPNQSEFAFMDAEIPILNPAGVQEILDFGLHGYALSRSSGLWTALIALADTMDSGTTVDVDPARLDIRYLPEWSPGARRLSARLGATAASREEQVRALRLPAALAYVRQNGLDRVAFGAARPRFAIVTTGKAYLDLLDALAAAGLDSDNAARIGLGVYKVAMPWPLEPAGLRAFASGAERLLVVEHKRALMEPQIRDHLYDLPEAARPIVEGKRDLEGKPFLSDRLALGFEDLVAALARWLPEGDYRARAASRVAGRREADRLIAAAIEGPQRTPYYCAGCPHNRSTAVPEGSRALGGIGCHIMAHFAGRDTPTFCQMGGEGVHWIGQAPFTDELHVFANLGDGTYSHSGSLAIRAALAAKARITYKILFNDAVAMTGGQAIEGALTVERLTKQLAAEGVERIAVVSEEPARLGLTEPLSPVAELHERTEIRNVENSLKAFPGVSVLIFDQTCATEKRRRRKRGKLAEPKARLVINEAVCEDCGDCSAKSTCVAVEPVETPFGPKRRINQSACNKDFTCAEGFCPSFAMVEGAARPPLPQTRWAEVDKICAGLEDQALPQEARADILITGIGGMGVTTISAIVGMAASLDGRAVTTLDMTGLAQKGGAVLAHIRLAPQGARYRSPRIPAGGAGVLLAADPVVSASAEAMNLVNPGRTAAVVNSHLAPTADFALGRGQPDLRVALTRLDGAVRVAAKCDASALAETLLGDQLFANMILLGTALERGLLPVSRANLEAAIRLNGQAVDANLKALALGRALGADPALGGRLTSAPAATHAAPQSLAEIVRHRMAHLTRYQDARLAAQYEALVERVRVAEDAAVPGSTHLAEAVARAYAKLLAYKDEYEVARAYAVPAFRALVEREVGSGGRISLLLAPPLFAKIDPATGEPRKRRFGPWIFPVLRALARLKGLRGSWADPFGWTAERRAERALIGAYEARIEGVLSMLSPERLDRAVALARVPERIRGFGPVKARAIEAARKEDLELWDAYLTVPSWTKAA